jgi:hypothetical protein
VKSLQVTNSCRAAQHGTRQADRRRPGTGSSIPEIMGLQSVEQALERMVESVFSRSSRTTLRPVELGRRLLRDIDDHRSVDVKGRRIVPNAFTFYLSPADHAGFADIDTALRHELTEAAREYARDEGYHFVGPVSIAFEVDNNLKPGRFGIFSHLRETPLAAPVAPDAAPVPAPAAQAPVAPVAPPAPLAPPAVPAATEMPLPGFSITPAIDDAPVPAAAAPVQHSAPATIVLPSGQRLAVTAHAITIGRLPECTIVLNDPNTSRRHAEIRRGLQGTTVVDLGSTNGTKVNGQRITSEHTLAAGDIITVGNTHLRFEAS